MPEPKRETVDINALFADLSALYGREQLSATAADEPLSIVGDREQLHRVLINLINNGLQAQASTSVGTPVRLGVERVGNELLIEVTDHGPGVPVEERRRIFEPDVTTKSDGMGLGLAIVEATIEAHGGGIAVDDAPNGGARFRIRLPQDQTRDERGAS